MIKPTIAYKQTPMHNQTKLKPLKSKSKTKVELVTLTKPTM